MIKKGHKVKIDVLAHKIAKLLSDYYYDSDTAIYFNGKRLQCFTTNDRGGWIEEEGFKGSDYCNYANDESITMTFEGCGSIYDVINGYSRNSNFAEAFNQLLDRYGYYYELGNAWNLSLYKL